MTKAAFYVLAAESHTARDAFVVKFARQSFRQGRSVHLHVRDATEAARLDQALWADNTSFIPHQTLDASTTTPRPHLPPVTLGWTDPMDRHEVLVNLAGPLPDWFAQFAHLVEVVIQEQQVLADTRANWQHLSHFGYPISKHDLRS